ncbi:(Fe-S)-binding protein [Desulfovibrio inopinatus]|uniref:(Fe-S)-binding protein n=1 Tax=Desulfovibrio inopinatus TaxID=102109 RepID=UPI0004015B44|nr:(Fe-S)-binding protein [Desulfovibrio inopinatus]
MPKKPVVTLFIQCLVEHLAPEAGMAMVRLFDRLGVDTVYPENQTCCGQPVFNAGHRDKAMVAARRFIEIFESAEVIVCPSGSCVHMIRHHYPELFRDDQTWHRRATTVAEKTYELSEFLVDVLHIDNVGARFDGRVTYHDSCQLARGLGIRRQPRALLEHVDGLTLVEMEESDRCCGFGGTFAIKYPELSLKIVDDKIKTILDTGADAVVGCDMGCLLNIEGRLKRLGHAVPVLHLAEILGAERTTT